MSDDVDLYMNPSTFRGLLGYVPQDDIIHTELPLASAVDNASGRASRSSC